MVLKFVGVGVGIGLYPEGLRGFSPPKPTITFINYSPKNQFENILS